MKNARIQPLIILTLLFVIFVLGLFYARTHNRTPIHIQELPAVTVPADVAKEADIININTATSEQLQSLPGIGLTLAERIVAYRNKNGTFESVGELMNIEGIGETKLEAIWDLVTTGG